MDKFAFIVEDAKKEGKKILQLGGALLSSAGIEYYTFNVTDYSAATFYGDLRSLIRPAEYKDRGNLLSIPEGVYDLIILKECVQKIEWIYQVPLFEQIKTWLSPGGLILIETDNLPFLLRHYTDKKYKNQFPLDEHPDISEYKEGSLQKWINFKLFSGCSKGDTKHCIYDKTLLKENLVTAGFKPLIISSENTLKAIGVAPQTNTKPVDFI